MGYYLQMDRNSYDGDKDRIMTCSGISEAIVLKIIDSVAISGYEFKIYKEVNDGIQDN